jgi:hypothetical protein
MKLLVNWQIRKFLYQESFSIETKGARAMIRRWDTIKCIRSATTLAKEQTMTSYPRSQFCGLLFITAIAVAGFLAAAKTAVAQGGVACEFGPARYRHCCTESYRNRPNLGAHARADDIDACMHRGSRDREPDRDADSDRGSRAASKSGDGLSATTVRRIECGSLGCPEGCATDEIAVSAFCKVGAFPSPSGDRDVQCVTTTSSERPTALICAKR